MAKALGRKLILSRAAEPIANLRAKSLSINNEIVDVTDGDSSGWQTYLDEPGQIGVSWSVDGVLATDVLRVEALSKSLLKADEITFADGATMSGNFVLSSYSEDHPYSEASTFSAELQSSGEITYTPAV